MLRGEVQQESSPTNAARICWQHKKHNGAYVMSNGVITIEMSMSKWVRHLKLAPFTPKDQLIVWCPLNPMHVWQCSSCSQWNPDHTVNVIFVVDRISLGNGVDGLSGVHWCLDHKLLNGSSSLDFCQRQGETAGVLSKSLHSTWGTVASTSTLWRVLYLILLPH